MALRMALDNASVSFSVEVPSASHDAINSLVLASLICIITPLFAIKFEEIPVLPYATINVLSINSGIIDGMEVYPFFIKYPLIKSDGFTVLVSPKYTPYMPPY